MVDNTQGNQQGSTNNKNSGLSWSQPPKASTSPLLGSSTAKFSSPAPVSKSTSPKPMPSNGNGGGRGRLVFLFLAGAVVGSVLTWGYYTLNEEAPIVQNNNATTTPQGVVATSGTPTAPTGSTGTAPAVGSMGGITLPNPQAAGLKVDITSAPVTVPTWVVVYEVTNGQRGNVLGAGYFTSTTGARSINLLRATVAGQKYWVGKRVDNGDKDFTSADQAVLNAAGQPLYVEFTAR